jgi:hypothetical protein
VSLFRLDDVDEGPHVAMGREHGAVRRPRAVFIVECRE